MLLLTLMVTLYDQYRQVYLMRFGPEAGAVAGQGQQTMDDRCVTV